MPYKKRAPSISPDKVKKILIIKLGAFGDMVFSDGVMRQIRAHYEMAEITLLTEPFYAKLWTNAPYIDATMPDHRPSRLNLMAMHRLKKKLISGSFDLVIDLQNSSRSRQYRHWLHDSITCGKEDPADFVYQLDKGKPQSLADILAAQVGLLGVNLDAGYAPDMRWLGKAAQTSTALTELSNTISEKSILLVPGASARNADKRWPHFDSLSALLKAQGWQCYTAPGPDEIELCTSLPCPSLMLDGKPLTFAQLAAISHRFNFVVGNDTGPTHLIAACQLPSLILLGSRGQPDRIRINEMMNFVETQNLNALAAQDVFEALMVDLNQ